MCAFEQVRVVILGQDPYHNNGQAHGCAFSVRKGVTVPPSLVNIYQELQATVPGFKRPSHGYLGSWCEQGPYAAKKKRPHRDGTIARTVHAVCRPFSRRPRARCVSARGVVRGALAERMPDGAGPPTYVMRHRAHTSVDSRTRSSTAGAGARRAHASGITRKEGLGRVHGRGREGAERPALQSGVHPLGRPRPEKGQGHRHGSGGARAHVHAQRGQCMTWPGRRAVHGRIGAWAPRCHRKSTWFCGPPTRRQCRRTRAFWAASTLC